MHAWLMHSWLNPDRQFTLADEPEILERLECCLVGTCTRDGEQRIRTAFMRAVHYEGTTLTLALGDPELQWEIIANPRVVVMAFDAAGERYIVITGLARMRRVEPGAAVLVDVAVQSMDQWAMPAGPDGEIAPGQLEARAG